MELLSNRALHEGEVGTKRVSAEMRGQPDPVSRLTLGELCYRSGDLILSYCSKIEKKSEKCLSEEFESELLQNSDGNWFDVQNSGPVANGAIPSG
ncbi:uncharacterized [Tachysurus ichikawai]